jgi:hypothetical protein
MSKNWLIGIVLIVLLVVMYLIEVSKVKTGIVINNMPTLDNLHPDDEAKTWDLFYKVRATITDGQSASFSIPDGLYEIEGKPIRLSGAVVFRGNGCEMINDNKTSVRYFFLLPTLGLARACELQPDEAMRWTIRVNLEKPWVLSRNEMIDAEAIVLGIFKIDTSQPYEAAFIIEKANVELKPSHD